MFVQLPLKIGLREEVCFDTYLADSESLVIALNQFQQSLKKQQAETYYLYGPSGVGKTHLLQAACRFVMEVGQQNVYLPLADDSLPLIPDVLHGIEQTDMVCLDDVDSKIGDEAWELALADLIHKSQVLGHKVILSGQMAFESWEIKSTELTQALISVLPIKLLPLAEKESLVEAMQRHANKMGFELPQDVGNFLVKQFSTDLQELLSVLRMLEQASMVEKRRVTLPFVKKVLSEL